MNCPKCHQVAESYRGFNLDDALLRQLTVCKKCSESYLKEALDDRESLWNHGSTVEKALGGVLQDLMDNQDAGRSPGERPDRREHTTRGGPDSSGG